MKKNNIRSVARIALLALPLMMLPGCAALDWIKDKLGMSKPQTAEVSDYGMADDMGMNGEKKTSNGLGSAADGSEVLVTIDGKPLITMAILEQELNDLIAENPELKDALPDIPDAKYNLLMALLSQHLYDVWVQRNRVDARPEYKKDVARMAKQIKHMVNAKYFKADHPITVTDQELRQVYEELKSKIPGLMESRGGINGAALKFASEAEAQAFLAKAKGNKLVDVAKAESPSLAEQVTELKEVNKYSPGVDQAVRKVLLEMKSFPSTELVSSGKDFWVVQGTAKVEEKYRDFNEVKEMLRPQIEHQKQPEHIQGLIEKYKQEYGIEVNDDAVKPSGAAFPPGFSAEEMSEEDLEAMSAPQAA